MSTTLDKDKIFDEIRLTVKYLLLEKQKGHENFENSQLFDKALEQEIISNFDNQITVQEYEEVVYEVFGAGKMAKSTLSEPRVYKEVQKLIRQYRMRQKRKILERLASIFHPLPSQVEQLRDYMNTSYDKLMREPLKIKINQLVKDGNRDFRRLVSTLRREHFEVDVSMIEEIFLKAVSDFEKSQRKFGKTLDSRSKKGFNIALDYGQQDSKLKKRMKEQMKKTLQKKAQAKRQVFMKQHCPKFRFEKSQDNFQDGLRILEYSGKTDTSVLTVKPTLENNRMQGLELISRRHDIPQGAVLDIMAFQKIMQEDQRSSFLQRWLKKAVSQMNYSNGQEVIWFLMGVLNEKFGLPSEIGTYLKRNFMNDLLKLDQTLQNMLIDKALEQV